MLDAQVSGCGVPCCGKNREWQAVNGLAQVETGIGQRRWRPKGYQQRMCRLVVYRQFHILF